MIGLVIGYWLRMREVRRRTNAMGRDVMLLAGYKYRQRGFYLKSKVPASRIGCR